MRHKKTFTYDTHDYGKPGWQKAASHRGTHYDSSATSAGKSGGALGTIALLAAAGAAAYAAAPHIRRMLEQQRSEGRSAEDVSATIHVDRPAQELYDSWRRYERFDQFMPDVEEVHAVGPDGRESDWAIKGPGGQEIYFRARITEDVPGRLIAWASDDSPASHEGRVSFEERGGGTEVRLELCLHPPMGALGAAVYRLLGKTTGTDPKQQARKALREFKRLMEEGSGASSQAGGQSRQKSQPNGNGMGLSGDTATAATQAH